MKKFLLILVLLSATLANAAAKQIIVLDVRGDSGQTQIHYLLWPTTANPIPIAGAVSKWPLASTAENSAIAAGTTIEIERTLVVSPGTSKANIESQLLTIFTQTQAAINAVATGCFFDGTTWSC